MSVALRHVTDTTEYKDLTSKGDCVIKFTASWCGPCRTIAPKFKELAVKYASTVTWFEVDVDDAQEISDIEDVSAIPLILFYRGGKRMSMNVRGGDIAGLEAAVTDFVQLKPDESSQGVVVEAPTTGALDMSKLALDEEDDDDSSTIDDLESSESENDVIDVDDIIIEKTVVV